MRWKSHDVKSTVPSPPSYNTPRNPSKHEQNIQNVMILVRRPGCSVVSLPEAGIRHNRVSRGQNPTPTHSHNRMPKGDGRYDVDDTHSDHEIEKMWASTAHIRGPIPKLSILVRCCTIVGRIRRERGAARRPPPRMRDEELWVVALDPRGVEPPRGTQLVIHVTEQAGIVRSGLHEAASRSSAKLRTRQAHGLRSGV